MTFALIFALLFARQVTPAEKCAISGTVVDSVTGLPLGKAEIVAEHVGANEPGASTTTDARGKFLIVDVAAGKYRLLAQRNGYLETYYGSRRDPYNGSTITLTAGQKVEGLQIKVMPLGVITGTVRDSDGEALVGAEVRVRRLAYDQNGQRELRDYEVPKTDDLGQYRASDLPPGKYFVSLPAPDHSQARVDHSAGSSGPPEAPVTTFYPGTSDPSAATPIELSAGTRFAGADITVIRTRRYNVSVHIDAPTGLHVGAALHYAADTVWRDLAIGTPHSTGGDVEIVGVPPGIYRLQFGASEPAKPFHGVIDLNDRGCSNSVPLTVARADVGGVHLTAPGCAEVDGHVEIEGEKAPKLTGDFGSTVMFLPSPGNGAYPKPDGTFTQSLSAGHYVVDLTEIANEHDLYVKSIQSGGRDILRDGLTISGAERIDLNIVLSADGGQIEGIVQDSEDKPVPGADVALIPNDPSLRLRADFTRNVITDQAGHFELKGAAPGGYKLFAWDDIEKNSWFDPDVLKDFESKGEPVTVKVKEQDAQQNPSQTVKLHVIPQVDRFCHFVTGFSPKRVDFTEPRT